MPGTPIHDVADTAFWIAHYRAEESERKDALFSDPLARLLAGERGRAIAQAMPSAAVTAWQVVVRTCVIDAYLHDAIASGVDVVLNLGAGLDTRPYRMELPPTVRWVEVDQPGIIAWKAEQLRAHRPRCTLERHSVDLTDAQARRALLATVAATSRRVFVLTEGVVPYLSEAEAGALADDMRAQPHVVAWLVDYISPGAMKHRASLSIAKKMRGAPFLFTPSDWAGFFIEHGFRPKETRYLVPEGERLGRPFPMPFGLRILLALGRLDSRRGSGEGFEKATAYVLLEPA